MRYTIDPLEEPASENDLTAPIVVEVFDIHHGPEPIVGPGDRRIGAMMAIGGRIGRARTRLTSEDLEIENKIAPLRAALRNLRDRLEVELTPYKGDQELPSADDEAEHRTQFEFAELLAYAALAVELETGRG